MISQVSFPSPEWVEPNARFFANRFKFGMPRCNTLTDGTGIQFPEGRSLALYKEEATFLTLNVSGLPVAQSTVAVDTLDSYFESDLGLLNPPNQTWNSRYQSDWAIAGGNFSSNIPITSDDSYSGTHDLPWNIAAPGVLANNSDPNGDPLTAVRDTNSSDGTVVLNADGGFMSILTGGFRGLDSFTYQVHEGSLNSISVTV